MSLLLEPKKAKMEKCDTFDRSNAWREFGISNSHSPFLHAERLNIAKWKSSPPPKSRNPHYCIVIAQRCCIYHVKLRQQKIMKEINASNVFAELWDSTNTQYLPTFSVF
ncbi:hypothetical protein RB195_026285 [Necator americanus]|uniref:Uncharacterized protein n=1 Tax=Necator americanus TaxID=51031 RepID=A0ABR1EWA1_NECAM